ncbi:hypothetical protein ACFYT3_05690 [Nocardia amikacinitolerans]|uniref:hypothetical protein n=1 Tax=Nocardia amikacinitolerans TaxID=756689 RepID=UPI0036A8D08D|nr:hypothetical protein [Nocardia amikacinitolerans]
MAAAGSSAEFVDGREAGLPSERVPRRGARGVGGTLNPGEFVLALSTWGLQMFVYYRAYRAFDAYNKRVDAHAVSGAAAAPA